MAASDARALVVRDALVVQERADATIAFSRAGVTQLAECLLPKSERLSAVGSRVAVPPNRLSYPL